MKTALSFAFKRFARPSTRAGGDLTPCNALQRLLCAILGLFKPGVLTPLVNEAAPDRTGLIGLSNEFGAATADGWAFIPYGEHPNDRGLQRFTRTEAEKMVGYFKNTWQRVKRAFVGMPILKGHPDFAATVKAEMERQKEPTKRAALQSLVNSIERRYPDKTVYGTIADMEAREDGLALRVVLTEAGAALVNEGGLKFFSPHWLAVDLPAENGKAIKAPVYMVSFGLTDRPNIGGTSLVNEQPTTTMPPWLLLLLGLANEATEDQARSAITALQARPETTALVNEQSKVTQLTTDLATATTALANERAALATLRTERNTALVTAAVQLGRITEATKPVWLGRLERDFATESVALANETGAVKTGAQTANLGNRKVPNTARDQFTALVNEALPLHGNDWEKAWAAVKRTANGKALFAQIDTPPAK